jgi:hypothetical protein
MAQGFDELDRFYARLKRHIRQNHGNILKQKSAKPRSHSHRDRKADPALQTHGTRADFSPQRYARRCDNECYSITRAHASSVGGIDVSPVGNR